MGENSSFLNLQIFFDLRSLSESKNQYSGANKKCEPLLLSLKFKITLHSEFVFFFFLKKGDSFRKFQGTRVDPNSNILDQINLDVILARVMV